jgi:hypothetical protein
MLKTISSSPYIVPVLLICVIILLISTIALYRKLSKFTRGENGKSLEKTILDYLDKVDDLKKHDELIAKHAIDLDTRLAQCIRNVSTVRFKAFDPNSSNQSFAISLVNEHGDGVILSSLHHRDRVSMFAKPVIKYTSTHDLTEEELGVLEDSKKAHHK